MEKQDVKNAAISAAVKIDTDVSIMLERVRCASETIQKDIDRITKELDADESSFTEEEKALIKKRFLATKEKLAPYLKEQEKRSDKFVKSWLFYNRFLESFLQFTGFADDANEDIQIFAKSICLRTSCAMCPEGKYDLKSRTPIAEALRTLVESDESYVYPEFNSMTDTESGHRYLFANQENKLKLKNWMKAFFPNITFTVFSDRYGEKDVLFMYDFKAYIPLEDIDRLEEILAKTNDRKGDKNGTYQYQIPPDVSETPCQDSDPAPKAD